MMDQVFPLMKQWGIHRKLMPIKLSFGPAKFGCYFH